LEDDQFIPSNLQEVKTVKEAVKMLKNKPINFDDCLKYAREKFQKYFHNDIK